MHSLLSRLAVVAVVLLGSSACSGGSDDAPPRPASVDESLAAFGIDTTPTPRLVDADTQEALPDDYAPFGAAQTFNKLDELLAVGFGLTGFGNDGIMVSVVEEQQSSPGVFTAEALYRPASTPWAVSSGATPSTLRAAAGGDVDGDGLEELLVVSHSAGDAAVVVRTIQDRVAQFVGGTPLDVSTATPTSLAIASGDFDGDGKKDAVVAVATAADVQLVFLTGGVTGLSLSGRTVTLTPLTASPALDVALAAGNLDNDRGHELVVVVNERFQTGGSDSGVSRYWIYDDANAGFTARRQAQRVTANAAGADRSALTASAAIGDVDGDNVGEVVLGGLTSFDAAGTCAYGYLLFALDGLDAGLASLGTTYHAGRDTGAQSPPYPALFPAAGVCTDLRLRTLHLLAFDRDGDGADEIQANQLTFQDFREGIASGIPPVPWTPLTAGATDMTLHHLFGGAGNTYAGEFSRATSAFAAGDLTGEGNADLVVYSQSASAAGSPSVRVFADTTDADWHEAISLPTTASPAEPLWPVLVTANVDTDSLSIQYAPASRRVVFTEPIVIAALAAPPCATSLGQDADSCRTSFGTASSTATDTETTWNVTAGLTVGAEGGVDVFGIKFKTEVTATIKGYYSRKTFTSYTVTKQLVYTTGPLEDAVIFTSVPFDQFTYRILSHPDPTLVGTDVVISLPREPIKTMVSRSFFNANVPEGSIQIDDSVFSHVVGQPRTYPTAAQKDALVAANTDLADGPYLVCGQTGGEMGVEIDLETLGGSSDTWGVEAELAVKATAGAVITGFSIGGGYESSLQVTQGSGTSYAGSVGCIAESLYNPDTYYRFGIMSYVHDAPEQPFEVINYWVE